MAPSLLVFRVLPDNEGMTREDRVFIDAGDLVELEFRCTHDDCKAKVSIPLGDSTKVPRICPVCSAEWFSPGSDDRRSNLITLASSLRSLRQISGAEFSVAFRITEQDSAK
jgi:hypothetical protein